MYNPDNTDLQWKQLEGGNYEMVEGPEYKVA